MLALLGVAYLVGPARQSARTPVRVAQAQTSTAQTPLAPRPRPRKRPIPPAFRQQLQTPPQRDARAGRARTQREGRRG